MPELQNKPLKNRDEKGKQSEFFDRDRFPSFQEARNQFEKNYLVRLLTITKGNVSDAAKFAKRNRTEFYRLLNRHHIKPAEFKESC